MGIFFRQLLLGLLLTAMFLHAVYALVRGRVYCRGVWYARGESSSYWLLVITYLFGSVAIGYLASKSTWSS